MDDTELRSRFAELRDEMRKEFEEVGDGVERLRDMLTQMTITDAGTREDAKHVASKLEIVAGKIDNAAVALANAAQSMHAQTLAHKTHSQPRGGSWERRVILALLAIIAALVGLKLAGVGS